VIKSYRGGSWGSFPRRARVVRRGRDAPVSRGNYLGLRLVEEVEETVEEVEEFARVISGGSWGNSPRYARVVNRLWFSPDFRSRSLGLRLVEEVEEVVYRGGSWGVEPASARRAFRVKDIPSACYCDLSLRLVEKVAEETVEKAEETAGETDRVYRGGGWFFTASSLRASARIRSVPSMVPISSLITWAWEPDLTVFYSSVRVTSMKVLLEVLIFRKDTALTW